MVGILWRTEQPNHVCDTKMGRSLGCGVGTTHWLTPLVSLTDLIQQHMGNPLHLKGKEKQRYPRRWSEV